MTAPDHPRYFVHLRDEGRTHAHPVPGALSLQDAALRFAEHAPAPAEGPMRAVAVDGETGESRCFLIDLDAGEVGACP